VFKILLTILGSIANTIGPYFERGREREREREREEPIL
jgi:hypothetical protein